MIFKSAIITSGSGSVGGVTLTHGPSGLILRARAIPTNPNTPQQQTVRLALGDLSNRWINTLTQAQRDAWDNYADIVTLTNPLGDQIKVSGLNMYVRSNVPRLQIGATIIDDGPTNFSLGSFTEPTLIITAPATGALTFNNADEWANEDDAHMLIYVGRGQNPSVNFFEGPYQFAGQVDGDAITPPTSPAVITSPFAQAVGNRAFYRVTVTRGDGRYSQPFRIFDPVV